MAKSKKKKNNLKISLLLVFLTLFLLILAGIRVMFNNNVKIDSRVDNLKQFQKEHKKYNAIAWLKIPGTDIDYPVLDDINSVAIENKDNTEYLWESGELTQLNKINYIMGHNVMNLSRNPKIVDKSHVRFEQLMSFTYLDFAKKNQYVQFTIDGKDYLFKIFAVYYPDYFEVDKYNTSDQSENDVKEFIDYSKKISIYDYDIDVNEKDKIISLITCTRMFFHERDFVVNARLVREKETTGLYKVDKNENYDVVEQMMEGGEATNEEV